MKTVLSVFLVATAALLAAGCGRSTSGSSVTGSVTYNGNPVTGGSMLFHGKDKPYPASLGADGKYTCPVIPPGDYTVTIDTKWLEKAGAGDAASTIKDMANQGVTDQDLAKGFKDLAKAQEMNKAIANLKYVAIPKKYADAKTSGLTVTVESGSTTKDLQLTD